MAKKNPSDATLRNVRAAQKKLKSQHETIQKLKTDVRLLYRKIEILRRHLGL